jgi:hypothetical protein
MLSGVILSQRTLFCGDVAFLADFHSASSLSLSESDEMVWCVENISVSPDLPRVLAVVRVACGMAACARNFGSNDMLEFRAYG